MKKLGIDRLCLDERLALMHEIWDSIATEAEQRPLTEAQKQDLQRRLSADDVNCHAGSTWEEVKARSQERE